MNISFKYFCVFKNYILAKDRHSGAQKAINNDITDMWQPAINDKDPWIEISFSKPIILNSIRIRGGKDTNSKPIFTRNHKFKFFSK